MNTRENRPVEPYHIDPTAVDPKGARAGDSQRQNVATPTPFFPVLFPLRSVLSTR